MAETSDRVGVCIVGCGGFARAHARSLQQKTDRVDIYFASRTYEKAARYADEYGALDAFGSYRAAADDARVDSLLFCTPHSMHRENLEMAAARGKNVLMEKPIATTVEDAQAMQKAADIAGIHFMVAENFRYMPVVSACADELTRGAIGTLRSVHIQTFQYHKTAVGWRASLQMRGGGSLIDGGIHKVATLRLLAGEPEWVSAATSSKLHPEAEGEEEISLVTTFRNGVVGTLVYSDATPGEPGSQIARVIGTEGHITFDFYGREVHVATLDTERTVPAAGDRTGVSPMQDAYLDLVTGRLSTVLSTPKATTGDLAFVLAAYESAEAGGQAIRLGPGG